MLSDESLHEKLEQDTLADIVRGDPELLERIFKTFPGFKAPADAVPLEALLPALETIPPAKIPLKRSSDVPTACEDAPASEPLSPFDCTGDTWGSAYEPLASIMERKKSALLADVEECTPESIARAEATALGLVTVGRLYKRVEPRIQFKDLKLPGHDDLVGFAIKDLLPAAARTRNGKLADAACKLLIGSTFDRLCKYHVTSHFNVRTGLGMDEGWTPPPEDADLFGIGWAMLEGPDPVSGLRVLCMLTNGEVWLAAQTALGLVGDRVCGAGNGSHTQSGGPSSLQQGLVKCLTQPETGELAGVLAAGNIISLLSRSEHPAALLRAGLAPALIQAAHHPSRPLTAALSAYALADLCQNARHASYAPWLLAQTEEQIEAAEPPPPDACRELLCAGQRALLVRKEEWKAGRALLKQELRAAGCAFPPLSPAHRTYPRAKKSKRRQREKGREPEGGEGFEEARQKDEGEAGNRGRVLLTAEEAVAAAWEAVPMELKGEAGGGQGLDAWNSYWQLCMVLLGQHFRAELDANEPALLRYHELP